MKRSRFDVPPSGMAEFKDASLRTLSHDAKRKRCEAELLNQKKPVQQPTPKDEETNQQSEQTTLWMGDLERWEDEPYLVNFLAQVLAPPCQLMSLKVARDFHTNYHLGYGFIDFDCNRSATAAFDTLSRTCRPGHNRIFKVRWAATNTHKAMARQSQLASQHHNNRFATPNQYDGKQQQGSRSDSGMTLHIGGLDRQINETEVVALLDMIGYLSVKYVRISRTESGESRGFGFIKFTSPIEFQDALHRLHGVVLGQRALHISIAHRSGEQVAVDPCVMPHGMMEYGANATGQLYNDWIPAGQLWQQQQQSLVYNDAGVVTPQHYMISAGGSNHCSTDLSAQPILQQASAQNSASLVKHFCSVCCGDCPLSCIETGFPIYYDLPDSDDTHKPSPCLELNPFVVECPISVDVQISNIFSDPFQYVFA